MIPYGRQHILQDDIDAVVSVLQSDFLTQGPCVPEFERHVADYCGVAHAVAVNSATSALHIACLAIDLGPGDWLWTSPITFVASANCARYCGASVDFVDIDPATLNMSVTALEEKLRQAAIAGKLPKAVVPVHFGGQSCDMAAIGALARTYGFRIIEDASHAIGGQYRGTPVGDCRFSDMTVFSFHPVKIVTTAEGGMVTTNDAMLAQRLGELRSHGVTRDPARMKSAPEGPWYYEQIDLGYNYRMTELQAALGVSQLTRLDTYVARRNELAARYDAALAAFPLTAQARHADSLSAFHLYVVRLDEGISRRAVFEALRAAGIGVNVHYIPVHTQPYYKALGFSVGDFPEAEGYYSQALTLPLFPLMTDAQQDEVISALEEALAP